MRDIQTLSETYNNVQTVQGVNKVWAGQRCSFMAWSVEPGSSHLGESTSYRISARRLFGKLLRQHRSTTLHTDTLTHQSFPFLRISLNTSHRKTFQMNVTDLNEAARRYGPEPGTQKPRHQRHHRRKNSDECWKKRIKQQKQTKRNKDRIYIYTLAMRRACSSLTSVACFEFRHYTFLLPPPLPPISLHGNSATERTIICSSPPFQKLFSQQTKPLAGAACAHRTPNSVTSLTY